jgi:excisionase family DNA binding protein
MASAPGGDPAPRFLTLADVAEILATSVAQVRALVQSGDLRYIQIGGRQQYRIEAVELESYIQRMYAESDAKLDAKVDVKVDVNVDDRADRQIPADGSSSRREPLR